MIYSNILKQEKMNSQKTIPISRGRQDGTWMSPENAAKYFRNGKGISIGTLYNNLRAGKMQDLGFRDNYGWLVFVPQIWIESYKSKGKVVPINSVTDQLQTA